MSEPAIEPQTTHYHVTITPPLVTLETAKLHLHITDTLHDADIDIKRAQASDTILDYLKHAADPAWTPETVPRPVQAAILLLLDALYERRGGDETNDTLRKAWDAITLQLARFRDPALA
jgi:hypothetical protein